MDSDAVPDSGGHDSPFGAMTHRFRSDCPKCTQVVVVLALIGSAIAIGVGITVPAFRFSYRGTMTSTSFSGTASRAVLTSREHGGVPWGVLG